MLSILSNSRLKAAGTVLVGAVLAVSLSMCSGDKKDNPADTSGGISKLNLSASPPSVPADGSTSDVTALATTADGTIGKGEVTFQVTNGSLNGGGTQASGTLANGQFSVKWACDEAKTAGCRGTQTLTANWNDRSAQVKVTFTAGGAVGDGGADAAPVVDAGSDGSTGGGALTITSSKPKMFAQVSDFATMTASVKLPDGGPVANEAVTFATDFGTLAATSAADAGTAGSLPAVTGSNGQAQVVLRDTGSVGTANVSVTRTSNGATAQVAVPIQAAQTLTYVSTKCGGIACTIMGVKNSGFNETADVTFKLADSTNAAVANALVSFELVGAAGIGIPQLVTTSGVTDLQGLVVANVKSGAALATFEIKATAAGLSAAAPLGVRGAIPSNKSTTFSCARVNLDAYNAPSPPKSIDVTCRLKVVDRFGNAVGTGVPAGFKAEAGTPDASKALKPFSPGNTLDEGVALPNFSTLGAMPVNTTPLPADALQFPNARQPEPSVIDGALVRNPRDGLVTIIAYVQGEEYFSDDNGNGTWDPGEQFFDQAEPFVDANDNGVRDAGEDYQDTGLPDGDPTKWDGPNGKWDQNTLIWIETRVLYTDIASDVHSTFSPSPSFADVGIGATREFTGRFLDFQLNSVAGPAASLVAQVVAPASGRNVTFGITSGFVDGYGMGLERLLVDSSGNSECITSGTSKSAICVAKTVFYNWPNVNSFVKATLTNPAAVTPAGGATTVRLKATVGAITVTKESTGLVLP